MGFSEQIPYMYGKVHYGTAIDDGVFDNMFELGDDFETAFKKNEEMNYEEFDFDAGMEGNDDLDKFEKAAYQLQFPDATMTPWGPPMPLEMVEEIAAEYPGISILGSVDIDDWGITLQEAEDLFALSGDELNDVVDSIEAAAAREGELGNISQYIEAAGAHVRELYEADVFNDPDDVNRGRPTIGTLRPDTAPLVPEQDYMGLPTTVDLDDDKPLWQTTLEGIGNQFREAGEREMQQVEARGGLERSEYQIPESQHVNILDRYISDNPTPAQLGADVLADLQSLNVEPDLLTEWMGLQGWDDNDPNRLAIEKSLSTYYGFDEEGFDVTGAAMDLYREGVDKTVSEKKSAEIEAKVNMQGGSPIQPPGSEGQIVEAGLAGTPQPPGDTAKSTMEKAKDRLVTAQEALDNHEANLRKAFYTKA